WFQRAQEVGCNLTSFSSVLPPTPVVMTIAAAGMQPPGAIDARPPLMSSVSPVIPRPPRRPGRRRPARYRAADRCGRAASAPRPVSETMAIMAIYLLLSIYYGYYDPFFWGWNW